MKTAIDNFKTTISKIDERINTLQSEVRSLESEKKGAAEKYRKMMVDDSTGAKEYTTEQLNQPKQRVDELNSQIQTANERIEMLVKAKTDKQAEQIKAVQQAYQEESAKLRDEIEKVFLKAREMRAQLTLTLLDAHQKYQAAHELRSELNTVEHIAGVERTHRLYVPEHIPSGVKGMYGEYDAGLAPGDDELRNVYLRGELFVWVKHYAETGEVVTHKQLKERAEQQSETSAQGAKGIVGRLLGKTSN